MSVKTTVYYKDFGAVGDGITDDFQALQAAHAYANENRLAVKAEEGAVYYIGNSGEESIIIKTSTDWTGATMIFDDTNLTPADPARKYSVIKILSDYPVKCHEADSELVKAINAAGGIKTTTVKIPYKFGYPAMIVPYDTTHKVYIRYGGNANAGQDQHEVMLVDAEGNIDKDTPALLDYNNISYVLEYRVDEEPITVTGGTVITRANSAPCSYSSHFTRNIHIARSNVTIRGFEYKIEGEGDVGSSYSGILTARDLNNLLVEDCTFQAHRFYVDEKRAPDGSFLKDENGRPVFGTSMGTYALGGGNSNKIYYRNCKQSNFYNKDGVPTSTWFDKNWNTAVRNDGGVAGIWGVHGTNYTKNITFEGCRLNRFDAHAGIYNATVINCEIISINLIGGGTALIKDTTVYNNGCFITLRPDFGSTWNGDLLLENVKWVTSNENCNLINGLWVNHNFGYETHLPEIVIDGFELVGTAKRVNVFSGYGIGENNDVTAPVCKDKEGNEVENKNALDVSESIVVKNCRTEGVEFAAAPESSYLSKAMKVTLK